MGKTSWDMSYTRQQYIGNIPVSKIRTFTVGEPHREYEYTVSLIASTNVEVRSKALEAARVTANRVLTRLLGEQAFPAEGHALSHEIVREHKFMGFAGADRLSRGMKLAFGRPTGRAARITTGQAILTIPVQEEDLDAAKDALERASKKLPVKPNLEIHSIGDSA